MRCNLKELSENTIKTVDGHHNSAIFGDNNCAHVKFKKGTDIGPILEGLQDNLCQCPHWGYLIKGHLIVSYGDGTEENVKGGDIFYWPPGHTVVYKEDSELVEFSPKDEMAQVLAHIKKKLNA